MCWEMGNRFAGGRLRQDRQYRNPSGLAGDFSRWKAVGCVLMNARGDGEE